jgi:hypothetical protein
VAGTHGAASAVSLPSGVSVWGVSTRPVEASSVAAGGSVIQIVITESTTSPSSVSMT